MSGARPPRIRVEAATACQLRCPSCPTTQGKIARGIGTGFLAPADFRRLLEGAPWVRQVELSNWGEIFLNPHLEELLAIGDACGVALTADNGANFNRVTEAQLQALVRHRLRSMKVSIDGATPETYARYRRGGDLAVVLANLRRLIAIRARQGSPYPALKWQFVLFEHNAHEVEAARELAGELGMRFKVKQAWDDSDTPAEFRGPARSSRRETEQATGLPHNQRPICAQLWQAPQVNWDGRLLGCCVNHWGDFGHALRDTLAGALDGEKMTHARQMLMGRAPARDDIPCTQCKHYRALVRTGRWMQEDEVRADGDTAF